MRTQEGPFPMETTYTWAAESPTTTRMTLRNAGEPAGFSTVAAPVMSMAMRRANRKDLANLKAILERAQTLALTSVGSRILTATIGVSGSHADAQRGFERCPFSVQIGPAPFGTGRVA